MGAPPQTRPDDAGDLLTLGIARLSGMTVAVPLAALREVVPGPEVFVELPATAPGLVGAMDLRGLVLPVVDLRRVLGGADEPRPGQVVLAVAHGGLTVGLLADGVTGVVTVPRSALRGVAASAGTELLFSHTFREPGTDVPGSVLDIAAVLRIPGLPAVLEEPPEEAHRADGGAVGTRTLTLLSCGEHRFAVDIAQVRAAVPAPRPRPSALTGPVCLGVLDHGGGEVAVVDTLALLGLGRLAPEEIGAGLVVAAGAGAVVLAIGGLDGLDRAAAERILPVPGFTLPRPDLVGGVLEHGAGQHLVLDGAGMAADPDLVALAAVTTAGAGGAVAGSSGDVAAGPRVDRAVRLLTYRAGLDLTTPLDQVAEIVPLPPAVGVAPQRGSLLGVVLHRGAAVPVFTLAGLLDLPPAPVTPATCVLIVRSGSTWAGFAVDRLGTIDGLAWTDPEQHLGDAGAGGALGGAPLVTVGSDPRLVRMLDLQALAAGCTGMSA